MYCWISTMILMFGFKLLEPNWIIQVGGDVTEHSQASRSALFNALVEVMFASRCVTITSQLPEAGHIATSWSGHCGETRHEEKGAWCMQWAHGSDDQIDASKVPHTMTVAELKRLAHLLFKQVGHHWAPTFPELFDDDISNGCFAMCFLWVFPMEICPWQWYL